MNKRPTIYRKIRALISGKSIWWIPSLKRVVLAYDKRQCESKFNKHKAEKHGIMAHLSYIFFDLYV